MKIHAHSLPFVVVLAVTLSATSPAAMILGDIDRGILTESELADQLDSEEYTSTATGFFTGSSTAGKSQGGRTYTITQEFEDTLEVSDTHISFQGNYSTVETRQGAGMPVSLGVRVDGALGATIFFDLAEEHSYVIAGTVNMGVVTVPDPGSLHFGIYRITGDDPLVDNEFINDFFAFTPLGIQEADLSGTLTAGSYFLSFEVRQYGSSTTTATPITMTAGGDWNIGFEVSAVPEPSTCLMVGIGVMGICAFYLRQRKFFSLTAIDTPRPV